MTRPRVSVIVPTRDRASSLRALLRSLEQQTYEGPFEIVIVDDGSEDETAAVARASSCIHYERTEGVGAVQARCVGVEVSTGEILAFTDDDCIADADWLRRGVEAINAGADVVQGRTVPQRESKPFERTVSHGAGDGLFPTCNVFYRRSAYERAGGFDRFAARRLGFRPGRHARGLGFGEDTLLGWAVSRNGRAASVHEAVVRHAVVRPRTVDLFSRAWLAGAFPMLIKDVPELRRTLVGSRVVLGRPGVRLLVYGLPLLTMKRTRPLGAAIAGAWVAARVMRALRRPGPLTDRIAAIPVDLALDATTSAALLIGSARARTAVL